MHIAIAGNIGSGKTTLTELLAKYYGWTPKYEAVDYNPYLEDYYKNIPRWSFNMEVFFLKERFKDLLNMGKESPDKAVIQDRSIYEGVYVFTANNYKMGNLDQRDFDTYMAKLNFTPAWLSPETSMINKELVDKCHAKGIKVVPWTVDTPESIQKMIDCGADAIISNYPDMLLKITRGN